jgi:hypothetical protein
MWSQPLPAPRPGGVYPGPLRVTRAEGAPLVLDSVAVTADSVIGRNHAAPRSRVSLATAEVQTVRTRELDMVGTVAVVLGVALGFLALQIANGLNSGGS